MPDFDLNDMAVWYPPLAKTNLLLPKTSILDLPRSTELLEYLDGEDPLSDPLGHVIKHIRVAAKKHSLPYFLRTGHGSDKHAWERTCYVQDEATIASHVMGLVEWSAINDQPLRTWALRDIIETEPICYAFWGNMPVNREFRFFTDGHSLTHVQFYWPEDALEEHVIFEHWQSRLRHAARLDRSTYQWLAEKAGRAALAVNQAVDGSDIEWSVDFLQAVDGRWFLIDMAVGAQSFRTEVSL